MYLGTNVILSGIQVFKEIYKEFPVTFFEVGNVENLTSILLNYTQYCLPDNLKDKLLAKYSYSKVAQSIIHSISSNS